MSDTEHLRELIFDLETVKQQERVHRLDTEALVRGLTVLAYPGQPHSLLPTLLKLILDATRFIRAALLVDTGEGRYDITAGIAKEPTDSADPLGAEPPQHAPAGARRIGPYPFLRRAQESSGKAFFDAREVPEWADDPPQGLEDLRSLVLVPVQGASTRGIAVFGHPERGYASNSALSRLRNLGCLVSQALVQLDLRREQTQRAQAEQELRESKRFLDTLVANLPGLVYRCRNDRQWTFEFVSDYSRELLGYTPEEFYAPGDPTLGSLIHQDDRDDVWQHVQDAARKDEPFQVIYRALHRDFGYRWMWERGRHIYDEHGRHIGLEGFITDVTQQKEAAQEREAALDRSRRQQEALAELARTTAHFACSRDKELEAVAAAAAKALEVQFAAIWTLEGDSLVLETIHQADGARAQPSPVTQLSQKDIPAYFELLSSQRVFSASHDLAGGNQATVSPCLPDTTKDWTTLDAAIRRGPDVAGVLCLAARDERTWHDDEIRFAGELADQVAQSIINDELRRAEQRLREERRFAQVTLQALSDAVIRIDQDGRVRFLNQAAERLTGVRNDAAAGLRLPEVLQLFDEKTDRALDLAATSFSPAPPSLRPGDEVVLISGDQRRFVVEITSINPIWTTSLEAAQGEEEAVSVADTPPSGRPSTDQRGRPPKDAPADRERDSSGSNPDPPDKEPASAEAQVSQPKSGGQPSGAVIVLRDISERRHLARRMAYQARHDSVTGLTNRLEFEARLEQLINDVRSSDRTHVLLYLDLDQFKLVNDTCGHPAGDAFLRRLSALLARNIRSSDTISRVGGDEFGVLLADCNLAVARRIAQKLLETTASFRFTWEDKLFNLGVSIGLVPITREMRDYATILRAADTACYTAKEHGRNQIRVYHPEDIDLARRHGEMAWVSRINQALEQDLLTLVCQRIVPIRRANRPQRWELLLRMLGDDGSLIPPGSFLPAAERYGIIGRIDRWVVRTVFQRLEELSREAGRKGRPLDTQLSINLSGDSVGDPEFADFVVRELEERRVPAGSVCFEVTETTAITHLAQATAFINRVRELGAEVALDDFGSGMSSFGYLKMLHVDYLKIDGTFIRDIAADHVAYAMVEAIHRMAQVLGIATVAEHVNDRETLDGIRRLSVDFAQGFALHLPEKW